MQQTSKYQFNLVEGSDDFSPTPLNQNMEKVEEALGDMEDAIDGVMEVAYNPNNMPFVTGNYTGTGSIVTITLGFKPSLVIVYEVGPNGSTEDTLGSTALFTGGGVSQKLLINDDGFQAWRDSSDTHPRVNRRSHQYNYVAFR